MIIFVNNSSDSDISTRWENRKKIRKGKGEDSDSGNELDTQDLIEKAIEDSGSEEGPTLPDDDSESESKPIKKDTKKKANSDENRTKEQGGKKGKKSRRKQDDSDEDLEKVLAELEMEYSGIKKEEPPAVQPSTTETTSNLQQMIQKGDDVSTVKSAAQKKKEKKEKEKQKKMASKKQEGIKQQHSVEETDKEKKSPGKKTIAAMQEALKKLKEEEERLKREEEERIKREEEAENARLEALRLEQERKERKKQKEKERKERLKAEGKLLTAKQKADRARAQALIDSLKAQGVELPDVGERKPRPGTRVKSNKQKKEQNDSKLIGRRKSELVNFVLSHCLLLNFLDFKQEDDQKPEVDPVKVEIVEQTQEPIVEEEDDVKDAWDASSEDEESEETGPASGPKRDGSEQLNKNKNKEDEDSSSEEDSEEEDEDESESESEEEDDGRSHAEKVRDKALQRIKERKEEAEKNKTVDNLRAAIVCVLGHVDTGKTKILDKLRRTNVQDGEAGGITQQIGATNVNELELKIPGLLIIDTPGHESFSNLRNRGSSLCDIAILVVDIMHGLEPQTIESINILKSKKTPFIVALNKIDRLYDWQTMSRKDVREILKSQAQNTQLEFEQRTKEVIVQFAEQGLNAALFYENPDIRSYVSLIPTSAITGEGMGNLLALIVEFCQTKLTKRLMYSDELQATVLEVKAIPGLGTTIDVILVNGTLREGDTMLCAGTDGPIVTQIRSLLMPQPLRELRVKNAYIEYKEIKAAQGVKIAAKELEKAIAGLNLFVAHKTDEVDILKEEVSRELRSALSNIKLADR
ncbi:hypothetical protein NQ314_012461, partial [Rhamnusium bicolor]